MATATAPAAALVPHRFTVGDHSRVLEVYRDAGPAGYRDRQWRQRGERVAPQAFPEPAVAVADLLPPERPEPAC